MALLFLLFKPVLIIGLILLLRETERPYLCAGLYAFAAFIFAFFMSMPFTDILLYTTFSAFIATLYFWLLDRFMGTEWIFWSIAVVGFLLGLI